MLREIISGGQTGADQGILKAANFYYSRSIPGEDPPIKFGGWMPKGFLTEDGKRPWMGEVGFKEHESPKYPPRTFANVKDCDGTIRFASIWHSPGEVLTRKACLQYKKPYWDISLYDPMPVVDTVEWIIDNDIAVLNVAGNRESTSPGICEFTGNYLIEVLKLLTGVGTDYGINRRTEKSLRCGSRKDHRRN